VLGETRIGLPSRLQVAEARKVPRGARIPRSPTVLVPGIGTNGVPDGSAWRVAVVDGDASVAGTRGRRQAEDASGLRRRADIVAKAKSKRDADAVLRADIDKPNVTAALRKAAILKWLDAKGGAK
jgi:hypothetical protein